jgi:hypothetical protein
LYQSDNLPSLDALGTHFRKEKEKKVKGKKREEKEL